MEVGEPDRVRPQFTLAVYSDREAERVRVAESGQHLLTRAAAFAGGIGLDRRGVGQGRVRYDERKSGRAGGVVIVVGCHGHGLRLAHVGRGVGPRPRTAVAGGLGGMVPADAVIVTWSSPGSLKVPVVTAV